MIAAYAAALALVLVGKIPMPQMTGTWDHLAADGKTGRLFLSAQDEHKVDVVDLRRRVPLRRIAGFFDRPQGELYLPDLDALVVTNGKDGTVKIIDGSRYDLRASVQLSLGADMIAYDPGRRELYVESGGTDSKRGPGRVSVLKAPDGAPAGAIETGFRAAAMALETVRPLLYIAIPATDQIAVADTGTRRILRRIEVPGRPASLALDEARHRLFVTTRSFAGDPRPPSFNVLDTETGRPIAALASKDGTESMFYDTSHRRIYTTGLEGFVQAYQQSGADGYSLTATIPTVPHAGTSQFVPELNLLCVAAPPHGTQPAEVWLFEPAP